MITKGLMRVAMFTRVSHLDITIDSLFDFWFGVLVNISLEEVVVGGWDGVGIEAFADVLINVFSEVVDIGIDTTLVGGEIVVAVASTVIALELVVSVSFTIDALVAVSIDALSAVYSGDVTIVPASGIGVDMLADVDANVLATVMADLKIIVLATLADSVPFC